MNRFNSQVLETNRLSKLLKEHAGTNIIAEEASKERSSS